MKYRGRAAAGEEMQTNAPLIIYRTRSNWVTGLWSCSGLLQASENSCVGEKTAGFAVDKTQQGTVEIGWDWESVQTLHSLKHVHTYLYVYACKNNNAYSPSSAPWKDKREKSSRNNKTIQGPDPSQTNYLPREEAVLFREHKCQGWAETWVCTE